MSAHSPRKGSILLSPKVSKRLVGKRLLCAQTLTLQTGKKTRAGTALDPLLLSFPHIKICKAPATHMAFFFLTAFARSCLPIFLNFVFALGIAADTGL